MRLLKLVAVSVLAAPLPFAACASSTAASVELWTDIPCADLNSSVFIATDLAAARDKAHSTTEVPERVVGSQSIEYDCSKLKLNGNPGFYKLGDLTLFPKVTDNTRVAVVVSVNNTARSEAAKSASACRAEAQRNDLSNQCMEVAATFDYRANETRRVIVRLTKDCFGVACATGATCVNQQCVSTKASVQTGNAAPPQIAPPDQVELKDAGPAPRDVGIIPVNKPDTGILDGGLSKVDAGKADAGKIEIELPDADTTVLEASIMEGGPVVIPVTPAPNVR